MKISDLNKIDIKNIDLNKIQEELLQKPELLINIGIVLFSGLLIFNIVGGRINEAKKLKTKVQKLEEKVAAIKNYDAAQNEFKDLIAGLPEGISEDSLLDHLTDFAGKRGIQILTFSPPNKITRDYHIINTVNMRVSAESYTDMLRFIHDIENSPYNLRIDSWGGSMQMAENTGQPTEGKKQIISAELEISGINFIK